MAWARVGHTGLVTIGQRYPAGDYRRPALAAVLHDLNKVDGLRVGRWPDRQGIDAQHIDPSPGGDEPGTAAIDVGDGQVTENPVHRASRASGDWGSWVDALENDTCGQAA